MNVTIYSTTTCATCHLLSDWLDKQQVAYTKKNTDEDTAAMVEFMTVNDGMIGVPFTVITQDDGSQTKLLGFEPAKLKQALAL
ncbi:MAG TPA: glutaredoxin family protein [Candidatus Saccharimonadales bacterium]|nr:glutaredoxin family protein [Candidatus Saccharimonadales bacterium]